MEWEQSLLDELNKLIEIKEAKIRRIKELEHDINKDIKKFTHHLIINNLNLFLLLFKEKIQLNQK
jgi:hypothetical protein